MVLREAVRRRVGGDVVQPDRPGLVDEQAQQPVPGGQLSDLGDDCRSSCRGARRCAAVAPARCRGRRARRTARRPGCWRSPRSGRGPRRGVRSAAMVTTASRSSRSRACSSSTPCTRFSTSRRRSSNSTSPSARASSSARWSPPRSVARLLDHGSSQGRLNLTLPERPGRRSPTVRGLAGLTDGAVAARCWQCPPTRRSPPCRLAADPTPVRPPLDLAPDECWTLAAAQPVGRLAWTGPHGPTVIPVNFAVTGGRGARPHDGLLGAGPRVRRQPGRLRGRRGRRVDPLRVERADAGPRAPAARPRRGERPGRTSGPPGPRSLQVRIDVTEVTGRRLTPSA